MLGMQRLERDPGVPYFSFEGFKDVEREAERQMYEGEAIEREDML